jgi:hypothetical protein
VSLPNSIFTPDSYSALEDYNDVNNLFSTIEKDYLESYGTQSKIFENDLFNDTKEN